MAEKTQMEPVEEAKNQSLIDPIYEKFVRGVTRAIGSTEFYEFFMDAVSRAQNEFQFSNRKLVKTVDLKWVNTIESTLEAMQNIIASPRNIIKEEELIVNVANARKAGAETVRHLAQHSALVEKFDGDSGEVLLEGRTKVRAGENADAGTLRVDPSEQRLLVVRWQAGDGEMANHFITGFPKYKKEDLFRWLETIRKLPGGFDIEL